MLVNNAGKTLNKPLLEACVADWDTIMAINARGYFLHSREAVRAMLAIGGGSSVNVASIVTAVGMKETAAYAASKGAIAQLTKVIALEYGEQGIRANAIGVGVVETDILAGIVEDSPCDTRQLRPHACARSRRPARGDRADDCLACLPSLQLCYRRARHGGRWVYSHVSRKAELPTSYGLIKKAQCD